MIAFPDRDCGDCGYRRGLQLIPVTGILSEIFLTSGSVVYSRSINTIAIRVCQYGGAWVYHQYRYLWLLIFFLHIAVLRLLSQVVLPANGINLAP